MSKTRKHALERHLKGVPTTLPHCEPDRHRSQDGVDVTLTEFSHGGGQSRFFARNSAEFAHTQGHQLTPRR